MFRNIIWMGLSSAVRLGTNLLLFVLLARHLGPEEFGHYMYWYGITFLCTLLANYGLGNMLLKEIAQHPENVTDTLGESLCLRLMISAGIFLCVLGSSIMVDRPELLLLLLLAHILEAISDTFYVAYRAVGHYARESQIAACAASAQLAFVAVAIITNQNTGMIAFAHLVGKIVQLMLILPVSRQTFGKFALTKSVYTAYRLAIRARAYAIDNFLGSAFGNIDSIVLKAFSGMDIVGIYQSGMRIFQGGAQAAPILANVFLPEMAKQTFRKEKQSRIAVILQASFLTYGLIFGLALAYFPNQIVNFAFGENYKQLAALFPFFGFLFFMRFCAAAWGVILTATGHQGYRAKVAAIHLVFMLLVGSYFAYRIQAQGWLIASILANILLCILQMLRTIRMNLGASAAIGVSMISFGMLLFVPALLWN